MSDALVIDGVEVARIPFGEERDREESPCPECGAYYFELHEWGCRIEECPACGGILMECGHADAPKAG
ncbi:MAG: hypothetical protein ACXVEF_19030 [Polyangiales bacterium]